MIGPSDLYRVPLCTSPSAPEELLRYARTEHAATGLAWALPATPAGTPRGLGLRPWLASHLHPARATTSRAATASFRPGLAAVHFGGESPHEATKGHVRAATDHTCDVVATSALILTVQPSQPASDEACTCEH